MWQYYLIICTLYLLYINCFCTLLSYYLKLILPRCSHRFLVVRPSSMESRHHPCPVQRRVSHGGCGSIPDWSVLMLLGLPGAIMVQPAPSSCSGGSVCVRLLLWFPSPSSLWFLAVVGQFMLFVFGFLILWLLWFCLFSSTVGCLLDFDFLICFQICWDLQGSKFSIMHPRC
jgi:hypothetical protein